jgi:hypothetical protein
MLLEGQPLTCTICGKQQRDHVYSPKYDDAWEAQAVQRRFGVDAFADFVICEECCGGYCGAVPSKNATAWLVDHI